MRLGIRQHLHGRLRSPWWERSIGALGVVLLADSFLPWYRLSWTVSRYGSGQQTHHVNTATAWHSSSAWSLAVLLGVIAAAGQVTCGVYANRWPTLSVRLRWLLLLTATTGLLVATVSWLAIPSVDAASGYGSVAAEQIAGGVRFGDIVRDHLSARETNVAWGFYLAVFIMMALVLLMLLDVVRRADRHAAAIAG
ncbi:hypothetical protein FJK98_03350 [Micromonospora sp. HM134]|uniref:hypothetical protein n=1 Tax=Micromonospora sp. HM134 TaxID=2583243 RepID=UPI001198BAE7|nr:hypothetical protein [Micromonospora sp. HM134]QDY06322.1 hypothetical protein FJK98_03350 [Micromonospora sp. HM134]